MLALRFMLGWRVCLLSMASVGGAYGGAYGGGKFRFGDGIVCLLPLQLR